MSDERMSKFSDLFEIQYSSLVGSVVNPNTLNLDPDPDSEFRPNLDSDQDPGLCYKFY